MKLERRRVLVVIPTCPGLVEDGLVVPDPQGNLRIELGITVARQRIQQGDEVTIGICGGDRFVENGRLTSHAELYAGCIPGDLCEFVVTYGKSDATVPDLIGLAQLLRGGAFCAFDEVVFCSQHAHRRSVWYTLALLFGGVNTKVATAGKLPFLYVLLACYNWFDPMYRGRIGRWFRETTARRGKENGKRLTAQLEAAKKPPA